MTKTTCRFISFDEALLLLRGWTESKSLLRVNVRSPEVWFGGFCTVKHVGGDRVEFWLRSEADKNAVGFLLSDCRFRFGDVPATDADSDLLAGGKVESGLVGVRIDFEISVLLLKS